MNTGWFREGCLRRALHFTVRNQELQDVEAKFAKSRRAEQMLDYAPTIMT